LDAIRPTTEETTPMRSSPTTARSMKRVRRARAGAGRSVVVAAALATLVVVAVAATVAACGGDSPAPTATVTVTAAPSDSASISPTPSGSSRTAAAAAQLVVAVASGSGADGISVVGAGGKVEQLVAPSGGPISDLSWAPDGRRLAFLRAVSETDTATSLFVYDVPRKLLYQVAGGASPGTVESFAWLDSTRLVESYFPAGGTTYRTNGTLYVRDLVASSGQALKDGDGHLLKGVGVSASADGVRLAFVTYGARSGATIAEKLRVYDAAGPAVTTVATGEAPAMEDGDQFTWPSISPDGAMVATEQTGSDVGFGLTVYGLDGAERLQANGLAWPAPVSWTPHGLRLAFGGAAAVGSIGGDSLHVWTTGASRAARILTVARLPVTAVAWTPKASQIAYTVSKPSGLQSSLWIVNADGSNRHLLLSEGSSPAWAVARIAFP
jgi:WD40-like Beta Propeller Repeat